jgi:hypothetical protein
MTKNVRLQAFLRMNIFTSLSKLALLIGVCAVTLPTPPAHSQGKGKGKAKGKQNVDVRENHGRDGGELPFGLQRHTDNKGELPSGLQKKKDEEEYLTRGLEESGKGLKSTGKSKKKAK